MLIKVSEVATAAVILLGTVIAMFSVSLMDNFTLTGSCRVLIDLTYPWSVARATG